ncbi:MAG: ribonuclease HII, partial [Candidatus Eisenbacteria bacterium]
IDGHETVAAIGERGLEQQAVIGGDGKCLSIAAASILAKVVRDRIMVRLDRVWPAYGFAQHKGYGTAEHMQAIREHGPCPAHRWSFAPVSELELPLV